MSDEPRSKLNFLYREVLGEVDALVIRLERVSELVDGSKGLPDDLRAAASQARQIAVKDAQLLSAKFIETTTSLESIWAKSVNRSLGRVVGVAISVGIAAGLIGGVLGSWAMALFILR